jgi:transcriptional regulator with XRE-family HTH domain
MQDAEPSVRDPDDPAAMSPGPNIRRIRRSKDITLLELARQTGLSEGFISQVERQKANPSFSSLLRIAGALNVPMSLLVAGTDEATAVPGPARRALVDHPSGVYRDRLVTPANAKTIQVIEAVLEPGDGSRVAPYAHPDEEECVVMLDGQLEFQSGETVYQLRAGESVLIDPGTPHSYRNPGQVPARWLWISATQGRRHESQGHPH